MLFAVFIIVKSDCSIFHDTLFLISDICCRGGFLHEWSIARILHRPGKMFKSTTNRLSLIKTRINILKNINNKVQLQQAFDFDIIK